MPFIKPPVAAIDGFNIRLTVTEASPTPIVTVEFAARLLDATGQQLHYLSGDISADLTPAQLTAFTNAALSLYTRAKAALIP